MIRLLSKKQIFSTGWTKRINKDNLWQENDIYQDVAQFEKDGVDFDIQREILQGSYGEDCADFDSITASGTMAWKDGQRTNSIEGKTSRRNRSNLPV